MAYLGSHTMPVDYVMLSIPHKRRGPTISSETNTNSWRLFSESDRGRYHSLSFTRGRLGASLVKNYRSRFNCSYSGCLSVL